MKRTFKYSLDKRAKRITWAVIILIALLAGWLTYLWFGAGAYFSAWFITIVLAIAALYILSIPRRIVVTKKAVEIHCIVELTTIPLEDIANVQMCDNQQTGLIPLVGSYGFFGYYGYYLDWRNWEIIKVYASQWKGLVEITDIYEQKYVVSAAAPEKFIAAIAESRA